MRNTTKLIDETCICSYIAKNKCKQKKIVGDNTNEKRCNI